MESLLEARRPELEKMASCASETANRIDSLHGEGEGDAAKAAVCFDLLCASWNGGDLRRRPRLGHCHGGEERESARGKISGERESEWPRGGLIHLVVDSGEQGSSGGRGGEMVRREQLGVGRYRRRRRRFRKNPPGWIFLFTRRSFSALFSFFLNQ